MGYFIVFVIGILAGSFTVIMSIALTSAAPSVMTGKGTTMRDNAYTYSNGTIQILRMYDAGESLEDIMQATGKTKATIRTTILASGRETADFVGFKNRYNASAQAWGVKWNQARRKVLIGLGLEYGR